MVRNGLHNIVIAVMFLTATYAPGAREEGFRPGIPVAVRIKEAGGYRWVTGELEGGSEDRASVRTSDGARVTFPRKILTPVRTVQAGTYAPAD